MSSYAKYFPPKIKLFDDKILVYLVELGLFDDEGFISCLSEDEKLRADKLKIKNKKQQFVVTRGILRNILSGCLLNTTPEDVHFQYGKHGKPFVQNKFYNKQIEFNVSHSGDYALLAFGLECQLGVDIEEINSATDYASLSKRFFSTHENKELLKVEQQQRRDTFYRCWARKEAFIKGEGSGVSFGLDKFSVSLDEAISCSEIEIDETMQCKWFNYGMPGIPNYKTAIAANKEGLHLVTHVISN